LAAWRKRNVLAKFVARQLGAPSGVIGRWVLAPLWNRRNAALNDVVFDRLALHSDDRVLEIGFGGGYLLRRMTGVVTQGFVAGVDVSEAMVAVCERRYRTLVRAGGLELRSAPAESLPYRSGCFSKACTVNSLFYWSDALQALREMHRVLEESGRLVVCATRKRSIENKRFAAHGIGLYEDEEVREMMERVGFEKVEMGQASDRHREFVCLVGEKWGTAPPTPCCT
jgi:SAM-dependent methyltransferase